MNLSLSSILFGRLELSPEGSRMRKAYGSARFRIDRWMKGWYLFITSISGWVKIKALSIKGYEVNLVIEVFPIHPPAHCLPIPFLCPGNT